MNKTFMAIGTLLGAVAVALGAFGAHGLKKIVTEETVQVFQTGVHYQVIHALALLITGMLNEKFPGRYCKIAGNLFITGIILFSGSLYLLTFFKASNITGMEKIGFITPAGGVCFIAGWIFLFLAVFTKKS
jgi:uncharacterized membrane protein YgdD (TMEM256/DUF423 family)